MKSAALLSAIALAVCVPASAATVLDFEGLGGELDRLYASPLIVGDYQFTGNFSLNDYSIRGTSSPDFPGSAALVPFNAETHSFQCVDGGCSI